MRFQEDRVNVALQVIHRYEWLSQRRRKRLSIGDAHKQGTNQPRPLRYGDGVHIREFHARLRKRLTHHGHNPAQMLARSQFRHDTTVFPVKVRLRRHDVGQNLAPIRDNGGGRFVAGRLDPEDPRGHWVVRAAPEPLQLLC